MKKRNLLIITLLIINFSFAQENIGIKSEIKNIENFNIEEIKVSIEKSKTVKETNEEKIQLFGTLITPKNDFDKILVIISGTGKITQIAHKYLTESLLTNNVGIFRFDKRGVGKSTGNYNDDPQIYTNDFISIYNEFKKSKSVANKKIGFLGHSLGAIVTIETIENNIKPNFLIQWAPPIGKPREILKFQIKNGIKNYDNLIVGKTIDERIQAIDFANKLIDKYPNKNAWELLKIGKKELKKTHIKKKAFSKYLMPDKIEFARMDNTNTYNEIDFPTLVCVGENDILVDPIASENSLKLIDNYNIDFKSFNKLNHFFEENDSLNTNDWNIAENTKRYIVEWIEQIQ